ncbi:MAG: PAS domain S-box protein [Candidatus Omnitrophica bacterium]|nr:PAS domain S-box protein [Candidatus Omnitrophota bacterium]
MRYRLSIKILFWFSLFIIAIIATNFLFLYQLHRIDKPLREDLPADIKNIKKAERLDHLAQLVRYYDEVLTQSARNYAFTAEQKWKSRYQNIEPKLNKAIKEAIAKGSREDKKFFKSIDQANKILVRLEYQAIELTDQGNQEAAISILESSQYEKNKDKYQAGFGQYLKRRQREHKQALTFSGKDVDITINTLDKMVKQSFYFFIFSLFFIVVVSFLFGLFLKLNVSQPLARLANLIKVSGRKGKRGDSLGDSSGLIKRKDEIGELAVTFQKMWQDLEETTVSRERLAKEVELHKKSKEKIARLNMILRSISEINQMLINLDNRKTLISQTCQELINIRGYRSAWIVLFNDQGKYLDAASAGLGDQFNLFKNNIKTGSIPRCLDRICNERKLFQIDKPYQTCKDCPLYGYHQDVKTVVTCLQLEGSVYGALTVVVPKNIEIDSQELSLLKEISGDISLGLHHLGIEEKRKLAEDRFKRSQVRFKALFELSKDAIMTLDLESLRFNDANQATLEMFKIENREDIFSLGPGDLSAAEQPDGSDSKQKAKEMIKKAKSQGTVIFEWVYQRTDGTIFPARVRLTKMEIDGKSIMQAIVRDISDQKDVENKLKERVKEFGCLFNLAKIVEELNASLEGILAKTVEIIPPAFQYPGSASARLKYKGNEYRTNNFKKSNCRIGADIYSAGDKVGFLEVFYSQSIEIQKGECPFLKEEEVLVKLIAERLGKLIERKKSETLLKEAEDKFRTLVNNVPGVIYRCANDPAWTMDYISGEIKDLSGYPASDFINNKVRSYASIIYKQDKDKVDEVIQNALEKRTTYRLEYRIVDKNSNIKWVGERGQGVYNQAGELIWLDGMVFDITLQKKARQELKRAIKLKSDFLSTVSHELRTPLAAIKEGINIVYDQSAGKINKEQKDFLEISKRNVDRLARLINDVLDVQKLGSGKMEFNFKKSNINSILKEVFETMKPHAAKKQLQFKLNLDQNIPKIEIDQDKIIQVVTNLVSNAIKFTEKGSIAINSLLEKNGVKVWVEDTGPGIKKEDIPKLFNTFQQLQTGKGRKTGGTGLGLAISKDIINKHRGKIWVESELGRGSKFIFLLPIKERRA